MKNRKSLGQHWLKNREVLDTIASLACVEGSSTHLCLEVGPGLGTLTSALLRRFNEVVAVEYDPSLARNLPLSFPGKNLRVIHQDFLEFDLSTITEPYVVAANIPYYITSPIIQKLLTAPHRPQRIVLLIQKEVAERIVAPTGQHTFLSVSVQSRALAQLGPVVPRHLFTPPPQVDSQVIILDPLPQPQLSPAALKLAKIGFSAPRKKLAANLAAGLHRSRTQLQTDFATLALDPSARPAQLALSDWQKLAKYYQSSSTIA